MRAMARRLLFAIGVFLAFATGLGYLGDQNGTLDLFSHFRPHYAALGGLTLLAGLALRAVPAGAIAVVVLVVNAVPLLPYYWPGNRDAGAEGPTLRVLAANLRYRNADLGGALRLVETERPDIILLTELAPARHGLLDELAAAYPHRVDALTGSSFGVALLSRWPIRDQSIDVAAGADLPVIGARLCPDDASGEPASPCLTVAGFHGAQPVHGHWAARNAQIDAAVAIAAAAPDDRVIVMGDFNLTPWSPVFGSLLKRAGLRDTARGFGVQASRFNDWGPFGLPIDHVLVGTGFAVRDRRLGPDIGSDHLPVIADLVMR